MVISDEAQSFQQKALHLIDTSTEAKIKTAQQSIRRLKKTNFLFMGSNVLLQINLVSKKLKGLFVQMRKEGEDAVYKLRFSSIVSESWNRQRETAWKKMTPLPTHLSGKDLGGNSLPPLLFRLPAAAQDVWEAWTGGRIFHITLQSSNLEVWMQTLVSLLSLSGWEIAPVNILSFITTTITFDSIPLLK